jgi:hypothetical protein
MYDRGFEFIFEAARHNVILAGNQGFIAVACDLRRKAAGTEKRPCRQSTQC